MSVGGVSVNSLCQQGGLFALSVNKHSGYFNSSLSFYMKYTLEVHRSRQYTLKYTLNVHHCTVLYWIIWVNVEQKYTLSMQMCQIIFCGNQHWLCHTCSFQYSSPKNETWGKGFHPQPCNPEQIWIHLSLHHLLTSGLSAVNGCRQNESPNSW